MAPDPAALSYHTVPDAAHRAETCALWLAERLRQALARNERVSFMVSGGRSPAAVLSVLADLPGLDWTRIDVFASDERLVDTDHPASTEGMIRRVFADHNQVLTYHGPGPDLNPQAAARFWEAALDRCPWPVAASLLGIGEDAHTASLFPGRPEATDHRRRVFWVPETPPHPHPRLTLGPSALEQAGSVALIVAGPNKHAALARALDPANTPDTVPATLLRRVSELAIFQDQPADASR